MSQNHSFALASLQVADLDARGVKTATGRRAVRRRTSAERGYANICHQQRSSAEHQWEGWGMVGAKTLNTDEIIVVSFGRGWQVVACSGICSEPGPFRIDINSTGWKGLAKAPVRP